MVLTTTKQKDYELLDSGENKKLERYGKFILSRPDPQALWPLNENSSVWQKSDAIFIRKGKETEWKKSKNLPEFWTIEFGGLNFEIRPTTFKHTGLFPEQLPNWEWMTKKIKDERSKMKDQRQIKVLNLFGYTGGATLACAKAGSEVVHLDGSKMAISWARKNQELSGLSDKPIRWILDDARTFLRREIKRGNHYDAIIMDPPSFGHGPNKELWKIEEHFDELIELSKKVLSRKPLFFLINGYASGYSPIAYTNNLIQLQDKFGGEIEMGELTISESNSKRLLPCGIFSRWSR
jgi:23S rRNA (cytosine1962-C5)-methyltransferase